MFDARSIGGRACAGAALALAALGLGAGQGALAAGQEKAVLLARDGKPTAVIALPNTADAKSSEQAAADLLAWGVERMSGARLSILREGELDAVRVQSGRIEQGTPDDAIEGDEGVPGERRVKPRAPLNFVLIGKGELASGLGVKAEGLKPGGIRLKTSGNALVLLGGPATAPGEPGSDPDGVRYAVMELLWRLGFDYLWPGELGAVIPRGATVAVEPVDYTFNPPIRGRGIRWGQDFGHDRFEEPLKQLGIAPEQWKAGFAKAMGKAPPVSWSDWMRLGGSMPTFGHAGAGLRDAGRQMKEHPEWFALQGDGTRDQRGTPRFRLCKSNPGLIEHVANDIIQQARENPNLELVSLDPNDGGPASWCMCDACRALDPPEGARIELQVLDGPGSDKRKTIEYVSLTDRMVFYWNSVAERVTKEHPNLLFGVSAYSRYKDPPLKRKLHPNLVVRFVPSTTEGWKGWQEMGARRVFWRPNILLAGWQDGKLRAYTGDLSKAMRYFISAGMVQTDINTVRHWWAVHGLNYYAAARLCWDPNLEADQIVADYARRGFGAGAAHVERYLRRVEELTAQGVARSFEKDEDWRFTPEVMVELRGLLNEAEKAAADDAQVVARVRFLRVGLNYTDLQETLSEMAWRAQERREWDKDLARKLIDLNCILARSIPLTHNLSVNTVYLVGRNASFSQYAPIRGRTLQPSDPKLLERAYDPRFGLTGREQSLGDMLAAFGL